MSEREIIGFNEEQMKIIQSYRRDEARYKQKIAELEADRDSESRWAKEYLARAERAEALIKGMREMLDDKGSWHYYWCRATMGADEACDCGGDDLYNAAHDAGKDSQP
jgi:hypothetical protein